MQTWLEDAVGDLESPRNVELVLQCIRILSELPFKGDNLSKTNFGRIVVQLMTRASLIPGMNASNCTKQAKILFSNSDYLMVYTIFFCSQAMKSA